jgi:hypothetical protein
MGILAGLDRRLFSRRAISPICNFVMTLKLFKTDIAERASMAFRQIGAMSIMTENCGISIRSKDRKRSLSRLARADKV